MQKSKLKIALFYAYLIPIPKGNRIQFFLIIFISSLKIEIALFALLFGARFCTECAMWHVNM